MMLRWFLINKKGLNKQNDHKKGKESTRKPKDLFSSPEEKRDSVVNEKMKKPLLFSKSFQRRDRKIAFS